MSLYLDLTVDKQFLHGLSVSIMKPCVMHANSKCQRQLQVGIPYSSNDILYLWQTRSHTKTALKQHQLQVCQQEFHGDMC